MATINKNQRRGRSYSTLFKSRNDCTISEREAMRVLMLSPFYAKSELPNRRTLVDGFVETYNSPSYFA